MKTVYRLPGLIILMILLPCAYLFSQSNDRIDELLLQEPARLDTSAYLILVASGKIDQEASPEDAMTALRTLGLATATTLPETAVDTQNLSYILMKCFGLPGGVMYQLFPGPRYAYREMVYVEVVSDAGGPFQLLSGEDVIRALRYTIELKGGAK